MVATGREENDGWIVPWCIFSSFFLDDVESRATSQSNVARFLATIDPPFLIFWSNSIIFVFISLSLYFFLSNLKFGFFFANGHRLLKLFDDGDDFETFTSCKSLVVYKVAENIVDVKIAKVVKKKKKTNFSLLMYRCLIAVEHLWVEWDVCTRR